MSNFDFVTDSRLARAVYNSNNRNDTAVVDGWRPIQVRSITPDSVSPTFGAQLYEKDGQYKVVFRGTEGNLQDWLENFKYASYQDSPEFKDTVRFMARAVVQVAKDEGKLVSDVISRFTTTGHSQGGFEAQLASVMFKVKGTSLDGMGALGVATQFREGLTQVMRAEGVGELLADEAGMVLAASGQTAAQSQAQHQASVNAQQARVDAAYKALVLFATQNPLGFVSQESDAQGHHSEGINPQAAAMIVDSVTASNLAQLRDSDPQAWQAAWSQARQSATQQWMKAITLDWNGDGQISKWMPQEMAAGSDAAANAARKFNVGTALKDLQGDGYARFDVDGDGYREATQWVAATDALLGIDRDGNGVIDSASELFNSPNTPFDQRGWNALKYYDSNQDGQITRADAVWKLLRIWVDINGDGAAGKLETFTLDMDYAGMSAAELAQLKAGLDAAGRAAVEALKQLAVGSIDLATLKFRLADGSTLQAFDDQLKADALGTAVSVDAKTQNVTIVREKPYGANPDESVDADTWIAFVQDMSVLQELQTPATPRQPEPNAIVLRCRKACQHKKSQQMVRNASSCKNSNSIQFTKARV